MLKEKMSMKKIFISMMALAAFTACSSNFDEDIKVDVPRDNTTIVNEGGDYSVYAEVGVGDSDTKATYDNLAAVWEKGDRIAVLQEHANYGQTFSVVNALGIVNGVGTSKAVFNGNISVNTIAPRIYHIAYPQSATTFTVNDTLTDNGDVTYSTRSSGWISKTYYSTATGSFTHTYTSTVTLTMPTSQNGKWEPYMFGTTGKAVASNGIGDIKLTTLTGAVAVRVFEADGTTPKRVKSITITSDSHIAGRFVGTSSSKGSTGSLTSSEQDAKNQNDANTEAYNEIQTKARSTQPSTTSVVTKLNSLTFSGTSNEITATGLETIAAEADGNYIYYINVAPVSIGSLTITLVDEDGSAITRTFGAREFKASTRHGYNITWDDASLTGGEASTWYDEYATSHEITLAANTLYTAPAQLVGVTADHVLTLGVEINGVLYNTISGTTTFPAQEFTLESGTYDVCIYAKILSNGVEKELRTGVESCNVVSIPTITDYYVQTSYSKNGTVAKTNAINGDVLKAKANLSDAYIASNLVKDGKYSVVWSGKTSGSGSQAIGSEYTLSGIAAAQWGEYNCYVKIELTNGYVCVGNTYNTHITGIPYHADWRSKDYPDWAYSNISDNGSNLLVGNSALGCIISPVFHLPASTIAVEAAIAASTNATSTGNYNRSYIYKGTRSSSASESGTYVTIGYTADFGGLITDTPLVTSSEIYSLSASTPCMVFTAKDFVIACNTYIMQAQVIYAQ